MFDFYPVTIDLKQVCASLSRQNQRDVLDIEAAVWLRAQGFIPARDPLGDHWLGDDISMNSLKKILPAEALVLSNHAQAGKMPQLSS